MEIKLGSHVRDTVTGFFGTCIARAVYTSSNPRVMVQPVVKDDGTFIEGIWFDEERVIVLRDPSGKVVFDKPPKKKP